MRTEAIPSPFEKIVFILIFGSICAYGGAVSAKGGMICEECTYTGHKFIYLMDKVTLYDRATKRFMEDRKIRSIPTVAMNVYKYLYRLWISLGGRYPGGVKKMPLTSPSGKMKVYLVRLDTSRRHQNQSAHMDVYDMKGNPAGKMKVAEDPMNPGLYKTYVDWTDRNFPKLRS